MARTWTDTVAAVHSRARDAGAGRRSARWRRSRSTGQGDGTWLIDDDGHPVAPALLWLGLAGRPTWSRASVPAIAMRALYQRTGSGLSACQQGRSSPGCKRTRQRPWHAHATAFHCKDWLYFLLTGQRATDPSEASFTCGNFRRRSFDAETAKLIGISDLHAAVSRCGRRRGRDASVERGRRARDRAARGNAGVASAMST